MKRLFLPFMMLCLLLFAGKAQAMAPKTNSYFHITSSGWAVWNAIPSANLNDLRSDCEIDAFYLEGFVAPAVGMTVSDITLTTSDDNYSVSSEWYDNDDLTMTPLDEGYEFEAGHSYYMTINVQLNNECTPADEYTVYLDEDASLIDTSYDYFYEGVLYTYSINFDVEEPSPSEDVTITNDFENGMEGWTMNNCHNSTGISSGYTAHGGSSMFRFYYTSNYPQYLISPLLDPNDGGNFSFYYARYSGSYPETFKVGYSTTTNDPTAFTWGDEETSTNAYNVEFLLYSYDFPAGTKYVAIACTSNDQFYLFIDDITITYIPAPANPCIAPSNFDYALNGAELTLTWNASTMDAPAYTVYRSTDGVSYEPIAFTEDTTYTCALLEEGTYYYQVTASASGMTCESDPALTPDGADHIMVEYVLPVCMAPINLAAAVDGANVTLTWEMPGEPVGPSVSYDFEGGLNGWTTFEGANADAGTSWIHSNENPGGYDYADVAHSGTGFAMSYSFSDATYDSYQTDNYLVSPEKYLIGENTQMTFFYDYGNDGYPDYFTVEVSTESNEDPDDFTAIWASSAKGGNNNHAKVRRAEGTRYENWREVNIDLSEYAGQEIWVAFHHYDYDQFELWIDDVTIGDAIRGAKDGGNVTFNVYRAVGNGSYELLENVEDMTYTDEGLDNGTYRYQVTAIHELIGGSCESDPAMDVDSVNNYVEAVVDVTPACSAPSNFDYTLNGAELTLTWNASTMDDPAYIVYRSTDGENYEPIDFTEDTTYTCALLEEGTYYYQVTASGMTCESDPALTAGGEDHVVVEYLIPVVTCEAPIELAAEVSDANVTLTWNMAGGGNVPTQVTIGDPDTATMSSSYLPTYSLYENSLTQQIYTADEIGTAGTINALSMWLKNSSSYERNLNFYMKEVSESAFESNSAWVSLTSDDLVGSITLTNGITEFTETTIDLSAPFYYTGEGNLLICVQDATGQWSSGVAGKTLAANGNQAIYAYRDGDAYDVTNPGVNGYLMARKNIVRLSIVAGENNVTFNVYRAVGNGSYELYAENVEDMTYTDENLDNGTYRYQVTAVHTLFGGACESDPAMDVDNVNNYVEAVVEATAACAAPIELAAEVEDNNVILTWEMPEIVGPISYDFEDGLDGWTTFEGAESESSWLHSDDNPGAHNYTGLGNEGSDGFAVSYSFVDYVGSFQADNYLVSPEKYSVKEGTQLTFFYDFANDLYPDYFTVEVSTASNNTASDFTPVWAVSAKGGNNNHANVRKAEGTRYENWRMVNIDLSAYAGQEVWIAFHHYDYDMYEVWIDDVTIGVVNKGAKDSNVTFNVYRAVGNGSYELIAENVEGMTYTDEGLANGTYRYQVTANNTLSDGTPCESEPALAVDGENNYVEATINATYTCEAPTNFASSLEGDELTLTWNAVSDPNAVYAVYATIDGLAQDAEVVTETSVTYTLNEGSTYYFQVTAMMTLPDQTFCESDPALTADGNNYIMIEYTIPVVTCEAPINLAADVDGNNVILTWEMTSPTGPSVSYDFEGDLSGWTTFEGPNADAGTSWINSDDNPGGYDYTDVAHSGTGFALSYSFDDGTYDSYQTDNYMVSPEKYMIGANTQMTFFYDYGNDSYPDYFTVEVSTGSNNTAADFTAIWSVGSKNGNSNHAKARRAEATRYENWRQVTIDLSAYAGQEIWVAFHHTDYDMFELWIDDVTFGDATKGTKDGGDVTFNIYRAVGNGSYELIAENVEDMTYTDEDLADGTYRYQVTAVHPLFGGSCESDPALATDGVNDYVEAVIENVVTCYAPVNLDINADENNNITLTWEMQSNVTVEGYNVYRAVGNGSYEHIATVTETTYTDEGLADGTYRYQVTAINVLSVNNTCESDPALAIDGMNNYVEIAVDGINDLSNLIKLYPNPTKSNVTIEADNMSRIVIVNTLGQVVYDATVSNNNTVINMSTFGAGLYMVNITTDNGVIVKRVTVAK